MRTRFPFLVGAFLLTTSLAQAGTPLFTVAEKSNYQATSRHNDVIEFCQALTKASPLVRMDKLGTSGEGREIPLVVIADPPIASAAEAKKSGKLIVLAFANIHAGEVDGKEGLLMLARELALGKDRSLLKDLVIVLVPNFNPDGGERIGKHRPWQAGPDEVGTRENAEGFDLNRDFVKLETPEVQALVRFCTVWDPAMVVDCHTTNGSYTRYTLTYSGIYHPSNHEPLRDFTNNTLLPGAGRSLEQATGFKSFFYGTLTKDKTAWAPVEGTPRYGTNYLGFRNRIGILSESYVYAPFRDRVLASKEFVHGCLKVAAANKDQITKLLRDADQATKTGSPVAIRHKLASHPEKVTLLSLEGGKTADTGKPRDLTVEHRARGEVTLAVPRPFAYVVPAACSKVIENLKRHGIAVEKLANDLTAEVQVYRVDQVSRAPRAFQKHTLVSVDATPRTQSSTAKAGDILVRTDQPLGTLACYLLEPQCEDGLCTWNYFDDALKPGQDFPVVRLAAARPLAQVAPAKKIITYDMVEKGTTPSLSGSPATVAWLEDGEHYLETKGGKTLKVNAATGASEAPKADDKAAKGKGGFKGKGQGKGFAPGGGKAGRDLASTSPTGKHTAFVRGGNLYVENLEKKEEIALTKDGSAVISNGKADWVYFEEVFNRSWKAYWWSPDGNHIVFLRFDDTKVPKATVVDHTGVKQGVEITAYPRAGETNPTVKLGIASVAGQVKWIDLPEYEKSEFLIIRAGFTPDSKSAYFYVQNRIQTWLDFCVASAEGGPARKFFRQTTKAWVDDPGAPDYLSDGSFLLFSEETGYKHLERHSGDGTRTTTLTSGPWEVRRVVKVDEKGGWIYFTGTKDNPIASNLYRVRMDGMTLERLTRGPGDHSANLSPTLKYFTDTHSSLMGPAQVDLYTIEGKKLRTIDANPVKALEEYELGKLEHVQIPTPDGFLLEATVLKPAKFDPNKKYPVWFMTYAGPHAPTVKDTWGGGRVRDEALANLGFIIFRADPRSASGKGAASTWTAYKQLGIPEMKDIDTLITWLTKHPWVDAKRVGMSGHSYGGFMTAFAMTHSKLFAAGIAGAPVTDWHNYDTIYTERYMDTPQNNPKGYEETSVVKAAKNLHGRLLILHGQMDDNVHVQNSLQLVHALQRANKDFEMMIYPQSRHGIFGPHYQRLMLDFMKRTLKPGE